MKEFILPAVLVAAGIGVTAFVVRDADCCDAAKTCCEAKSSCCQTTSAAADKRDCCEPVNSCCEIVGDCCGSVTGAELPHQ